MGSPSFTADRGVISATEPRTWEDPTPEDPTVGGDGVGTELEGVGAGAEEAGAVVTATPPPKSETTVAVDTTEDRHPPRRRDLLDRELPRSAARVFNEPVKVSDADVFPIKTI